MKIRFRQSIGTLSLVLVFFLSFKASVEAAVIFEAEKTAWHGFDRYDFIMDEPTLAISPFKALPDEGDGVKDPEKGKRRCIVVVPKHFADGNPWSWRGCYWNHQPQTEVELLHRGFGVAYISANANLRPGREWDAWYAFLIAHGLSAKPSFVGMSRGGEFEYIWATTHPDKVTCIYADNPAANPDILMRLGALATNNVPLLHLCGGIDPLLGVATLPMENIYQQFGGRISVMIKEGRGHHPHSLRDPKIIADFMERSFKETPSLPPDFAGSKFLKTYYYSTAAAYRNFPAEGTYITVRGPLFTECYNRYQMEIPGVESFITAIVPNHPAPGNPWVFRSGYVSRDDVVDQALLAKGFYIVTGAVPYNYDGPLVAQWNLIYQYFIRHGFARKPVMEGDGEGAGEAYAWAIANPTNVSCIYAQNPIMHSNLAKIQPLENLAPLARARVPLLHVCGSLDPWFADDTLIAKKRYRQLGGKMRVIVKAGEGHYPLAPSDVTPVINFIMAAVH